MIMDIMTLDYTSTLIYIFFSAWIRRQKEEADVKLIISGEPATVEEPAPEPTERLSRVGRKDLRRA